MKSIKKTWKVGFENQTSKFFIYQDQDKNLDNLNELTLKIKSGAKTVGKHLDTQKEGLTTLDKQFDDNQKNLEDVEGRLKRLLKYASDCCLWMMIGIGMVVWFLLFFWLNSMSIGWC